MCTLFSSGKQNIFELADKARSSGDGLYEVVNRIVTLQAHGEGYAQEAVRLASLGSPQEIKAFVDGMFQEFDDDTEQLVQANLGAMEIPQPWKSISAKYFMRKTGVGWPTQRRRGEAIASWIADGGDTAAGHEPAALIADPSKRSFHDPDDALCYLRRPAVAWREDQCCLQRVVSERSRRCCPLGPYWRRRKNL